MGRYMRIRKYHIYLANLNPSFGTEPGKTRPVVVVQTDMLNKVHPSTIVCPVTSNTIPESSLLRVNLDRPENGLSRSSDIVVDQLRAIDNKRLFKHLGIITPFQRTLLRRNLKILLFA